MQSVGCHPGSEEPSSSAPPPKESGDTLRAPESSASRSTKVVVPPQRVPKIHEDDAGGGTSVTRTSTEISPRPKAPRRSILTVSSGPDEGHVYVLRFGETWIGRSEECDIVLLTRGVSRRHACVVVTRSRVILRENRAKNGTFINEFRIIGERELKSGDEIQFGPNASVVFSIVRGPGDAERQKAQGIASMVAGVAHQINTPIGVAHTASALIESLAEELRRNPTGERVAELISDLRASAGFVSKNLERTHELVKSFKQLSANEMMGDRREDDLAAILSECVEAARPAAERQGVRIQTHGLTATKCAWVGFPVAMGKVVEHLLQNSLRHGYKGEGGGVIDVRLKSGKAQYRLELQDYGAGVDPSIAERVFDPFVTSDREGRADGLGLAIVHTIVTTLFGGTITCNSGEGKGTKFIIILPFAVPSED